MHGAILVEAILIFVLLAAVALIYYFKFIRGAQPSESIAAASAESLESSESAEKTETAVAAVTEETVETDEDEDGEVPTVSVETSEFRELNEDFEESEAVDEWAETEPEGEPETEEVVIVDPDTGTTISYRKSFAARLAQSGDSVKLWYSDIKNIIMSFEGVRARRSWKLESFFVKNKCVAKLSIRGKTLCLYLAVNPSKYNDTKFKVEDVSETKSFANTPCMYRIKRPRRVKYAKQMTAEMLCMFSQPVAGRQYVDYRPAYVSTEKLIEQGRIKITERREFKK